MIEREEAVAGGGGGSQNGIKRAKSNEERQAGRVTRMGRGKDSTSDGGKQIGKIRRGKIGKRKKEEAKLTI